MSVREYIGARYIPVFADPIQWDPTLKYEPLTVVTDHGASYVSRRYVPEGIQLDNTDYWVLWADFNAQLQHYIDEVETFDGRIDALEDSLPIADFTSQSTVSDAIDAIADVLPASSYDSVNTVAAAISNVSADIADVEDLLPSTAFDTVNTVKAALDRITDGILIVFGDSWTTASKHWMGYYQTQKRYSSYKSYGITGAAFITRPTNAIADQLTTAQADTTIDKSKVKEVIIVGGVNDYRDNASVVVADVVTEMNNVFDAAQTMYPNAIVKYYLNCPLAGYPSDFYISFARMLNKGKRMYTLLPAVAWITPAYDADGLHLNDTGDRLITTYMLTGQTIPWDITEFITGNIVSSNADIVVSGATMKKKDHFISFHFKVACSAAPSTGTITIPSPLDDFIFNRDYSVLFTYADNGDGRYGITGAHKLNCRSLGVGDSYLTLQCCLPW